MTKWKYKRGALLLTGMAMEATHIILKREPPGCYRVITLWGKIDTGSWSKENLESEYKLIRYINI